MSKIKESHLAFIGIAIITPPSSCRHVGLNLGSWRRTMQLQLVWKLHKQSTVLCKLYKMQAERIVAYTETWLYTLNHYKNASCVD